MGSAYSGRVRIVIFAGYARPFIFIMSSIKSRYARIEISLGKAETEKELHLTGDYFSIISITGEGTCKIKLDHRHSQSINLREIKGITGPFEKIYFTTDGGGGIVSLYIGTGMAVHVLANPQELWSGGSTSTQISSSTTAVQSLASAPLRLHDVTILNSNGIYACYVGPYNVDVATFKAHAYVLLPHNTLRFSEVDMYSLGCISYDGSNNVILNIIGTYG